MKSWENLLGLWHSRALPPVNSLERCRLWQCLDLSGGMSFPKRAGRSAHGWDLSLLLGCQLWAQGQPQLPCTGISEDPAHSPQQPGLHLVLEGHGGKWGAGVNLRCQRFYTWLCCVFFLNWQKSHEVYTWALNWWNSTEWTKVSKLHMITLPVDLASSCHRFVI